jgi:hypothetical protein
VPAALNSGVYWTGFLKKPGTIVLEFLEPIAPGLKRDAFMSLLENRIETATNRLLSSHDHIIRAALRFLHRLLHRTEDRDAEFRKPANTPCPHLCGTGCGIYETRPPVCQQFLCGWRLFPELTDDWRPDLSGVLVMRKAPPNCRLPGRTRLMAWSWRSPAAKRR